MAANAAQPLVKVTLQSIQGISWKPANDEYESKTPNVTAAVSFSGSMSDMQVGSSCVCPRSGNLLVESQSVTKLSPLQSGRNGTSKDVSLVANFDAPEGRNALKKPHLTLRLPVRDPDLNVSIESLNRDCKILDRPNHPTECMPSLDESDLSSQSSMNKGLFDENDAERSDVRGGSLIWSASGTGMPEIIELNIALTVEDEMEEKELPTGPESLPSPSTLSWRSISFRSNVNERKEVETRQNKTREGIAYLVFFGHDQGTLTMDLPVKQRPGSKSQNDADQDDSGIILEDDASIRVKIVIFPSGKDEEKAANGSKYTKSLVDVQNFFETKRFDPILQQLRHDAEQKARDRENCVLEEPKNPTGAFCSDINFMGFLKDFGFPVTACENGNYKVSSGLSIASTIDTSPSMDI
mmetsp:Transcript_7177/g.10922  ORF Transcript_7177/g.10922 Transcript_7177/m.10922 type:complete len:410 (+) Transcript_7177:82-1311(+)|eukprot:CAMPEP_0195281570 /NCGR_PEP_ID=MMETSP0707-20130614/828_1 /TAXON_ID=33640 /ORGANISM="Asterionellopsis glacialis, Strain CCMP134" /LENGTH=409 /DNA_ID=CAMNT_0040340473 /DNA_START=132 /DNA_END=1361 /DNA_ORIENTATION=-